MKALLRYAIVATAVLALAAPATSLAGAAAGPAKTYESWLFKPAFTVRLPAGWTAAERDEGGTQFWHECRTCPYDGELKGEVTIDMALGRMPPSKAIARLKKSENVRAGHVRAVKLGTLSGLEFTATRTGAGDVVFRDSGYHTDPTGEPLEILVVEVAGRTVSIFIDPGTSRGSAARAFTLSGLAFVKALRFKSA
jgi:hypothetical protein